MQKQIPTIVGILIVFLVAGIAGAIVLFFNQEVEEIVLLEKEVEEEKNIKNFEKYSNKEVFLISGKKWKEVLSLIPVVTWIEEEELKKYPILIYHQENDNFDADSILHFINQYNAEKVTAINNLPQELENTIKNQNLNIQKLSSNQFLSYWKSFKDIVYVEDDYDLALLASTYASLRNAPLIISGSSLDSNNIFEKRNIICVGNVNANCDKNYNLEQIQRRYLEKTNTNQIILINPNDLDIFKKDIKSTTYSGDIQYLFGKTSLAAPILASHRRALILPVQYSQVEEVDIEINNYIKQLNLKPEYLTILASPLAIQQNVPITRSCGEKGKYVIDNTVYGNLDNDPYGFADLKTGRIYGFSISDVSSYIARASFYEKFMDSESILFTAEDPGRPYTSMKLLSSIFDRFGYNTEYRGYRNPVKASDWKNRSFINHYAHGTPTMSFISSEEIPLLDNPIIFLKSCSTCGFDRLTEGNYGRLFCLQAIRNGSLGTIASVVPSGFVWDFTRLNRVLSDDLGSVFKSVHNFGRARQKWYVENLAQIDDYKLFSASFEFLLGDPTLKYPFKEKTILPKTELEIKHNPNTIEIEADVFSYNIEIKEDIIIFIEGTCDYKLAKHGRIFIKVGPLNLFDEYSVSSPDVDPLFHEGIKLVAQQNKNGQNFAYFLLEKDFSENLLDEVAKNKIRITITKE